MFQQKQLVVLAVCVSALVAMVSAQSFNWESCQSRARQSLAQYRETMTNAARKFASNLQDVATGAADTSAFDSDIDQMVSTWSSVMNQGSSFDAGRISSAYLETMTSMQSIMTKSFRLYSRIPQVSMSNYIEFFQTMTSAQSSMMTSMSSGCMPTFRRALE